MTKRGEFVWYELMTSDVEGAKGFYTDVVGWGTAPFENATGMDYTMWMKGEAPVGGVMELPEEARKGGSPPHWLGYVAVPDVDATAKKAKDLGGKVLHGPEDIPEVGRFVVLQDPQGAVVCAFKGTQDMPREDHEPEPGEVAWHELATTDYEAAIRFYSDLFGWEKKDAMDMGEAGMYQIYGLGERMLGGMYTKSADQPFPPHWLYYLETSDLDHAAKKVEKKGGKIMAGPMDVPGGRIFIATDPQGAAFAVHQRAA